MKKIFTLEDQSAYSSQCGITTLADAASAFPMRRPLPLGGELKRNVQRHDLYALLFTARSVYSLSGKRSPLSPRAHRPG